MNVLIVEDELPAYRRLAKLIKSQMPDATIHGPIDSVVAAQSWLSTHKMPDLLFLDIHLSDGSAFDLIKLVEIKCPIVYTTAYDEYALNAFHTSSLDYLLKPVTPQALAGAFEKLVQFRRMFASAPDKQATEADQYRKRFVIRFGEHLKTLAVEDIAYCYSENKAVFARSFDGRNFPMDYNLDALEPMLPADSFFRINRQYIVSLKSIEDMRTYTKARVLIQLRPPATEVQIVSTERAAAFKQWLAGELDS